MKACKPDASFPMPPPGRSVTYERVRIVLRTDGQLEVGGRTGTVVEFDRGGVSSDYKCFAVLRRSCIEVYEGSTHGPGMITREEVSAACR